MGTVNNKFKDGVFCRLFGSAEYKENLLSLFNALNGTDYTDPDDLEINTIDDAIFMGIKNDASCILDMQMNLYEEQSTFNPNAPIRGMMYFGRLYEKYLAGRNRYGTKLIRLPRPKYYVLYLGKDERPDREVLRLSDAFESCDNSGEYEWTAIVLNINAGHNRELLEACVILKEYVLFVECARRHLEKASKDNESRFQAMRMAVEECIEKGILADYLIKNKAGVVDMYLTEWDEEAYRAAIREESFEDGLEKGITSMITSLKECDIPVSRVLSLLIKDFNLSREEAEEKIRLYW